MRVSTYAERLLTAIMVLLGIFCFYWMSESTVAQTTHPPSTLADIFQAYLQDAQ
ncbi:MAG: hypothetical protein AAFY26_14690 [Cyanobacteria bacterium J06638_22]